VTYDKHRLGLSQSGQIATLVQDVDPFIHTWVQVQVPRDREAQARQLLETLLLPEDAQPV